MTPPFDPAWFLPPRTPCYLVTPVACFPAHFKRAHIQTHRSGCWWDDGAGLWSLIPLTSDPNLCAHFWFGRNRVCLMYMMSVNMCVRINFLYCVVFFCRTNVFLLVVSVSYRFLANLVAWHSWFPNNYPFSAVSVWSLVQTFVPLPP